MASATFPGTYLELPPVEGRKGPPLESTILRAVLARVNKIRGVRVTRNNVGTITDHRGVPVTYGLGFGSPDVVGVITLGGPNSAIDVVPALERTDAGIIAVTFGLEVKQPKRYRTREQKAWAIAAERRGIGSALVRSADEAEQWVRAEIARVARAFA